MEIIHSSPFFFLLVMSFTKVALSDTAFKALSLALVGKVQAALLQLRITQHRPALRVSQLGQGGRIRNIPEKTSLSYSYSH